MLDGSPGFLMRAHRDSIATRERFTRDERA
jgi:hypothetical protein